MASSITVRPAVYADKTFVCDRLAETFPATPRAEWELLFDYPWLQDKPDHGITAEQEGRIIGYLGAIHSVRSIAGRQHRIANMIGWWVDPTLRGAGLGRRIADAWMARYASQTATMLTFRHDHMDFWRGYGIVPFENRRRVLLRSPLSRFRRPLREVEPSRVTPAMVGEEPYRIYRDHLSLRCHACVLAGQGTHSVVITRRRITSVPRGRFRELLFRLIPQPTAPPPALTKRGRLSLAASRLRDLVDGTWPLAEVMYISNPQLIRRHLDWFVNELAATHRALGILVNEPRLRLGDVPGRCVPGHYYVVSREMAPDLADALYSEIVLLPM